MADELLNGRKATDDELAAVVAASSPQWRCYCPISLCRALDPYGFRHALAYIKRTYGKPAMLP
jgi:hypothetical protein